LLLVVVAPGCGSGGTGATPMTALVQTAGADGTGRLEIGSESTLVAGAQGGFHLWLSLRLTHAALGDVKVKHTIRKESDGTLFSTAERTLTVTAPGPGGYWESDPAWPGFLCPSPIGIDILGVPTVVKLEISDTEGKLLGTTEAKTKFACPDSQKSFCESICKG
jgi:hypothetical protein